MTKKIFRSICFTAISALLTALVLIMAVLYSYFSDNRMKQLITQTELVARAVETQGLTYLDGLNLDGYRITWVDSDGSVKFDSTTDNKNMENHLEREEIKAALTKGFGQSSRYSATLTQKQLYCAKRLSDGTVIRLSVSHLTWLALFLSMLLPIFAILAAVICLSLFMAYRLSKKIIKPLNELNLDNPKSSDVYEELSPLINRISSQQLQIKAQSSELERKKDEFETATANMSEGIILLNENGFVISINQTASKLLGISSYCVGKELLLFDNTVGLSELLKNAAAGRHGEMPVSIGEEDYQFSASPIVSDGDVCGIALIIFDITEKKKAEQMRREFSANVSHELKTPLQSISGCAELLLNGMVGPGEVPRFSERIYSESKRMITLIDDIIKISHLDEGAADTRYEETDIYELAGTAVKNISSAAELAGVTVALSGKPAVINGIPQLLYEIVFNLCDNAVKYNKRGGNVFVDVSKDKNTVRLSVRDTGIGIPAEHHQRIFERFYRVDKSHSKEAGGTGLGLSIVKHAAMLHNAAIELESFPNKGTLVTVIFPA